MTAHTRLGPGSTPQRLRLYVVHGSHPCVAVQKALDLKGLDYAVWEWPPPLHTVGQKLLSGQRTVPSLRIDREMISGSREIMRRLDELVAQPSLYPLDPERRRRVIQADAWGEREFQPVARQLIWTGLRRRPAALASYARHSRLPIPPRLFGMFVPLVVRAQSRINRVSPEATARTLRELPGQLDRIDAWFADGTLGAGRPTAADLQILSTVRLLSTMADVRPLLIGRPSLAAAAALWPRLDGELPKGAIDQAVQEFPSG
jgi:glutathione S-transferase